MANYLPISTAPELGYRVSTCQPKNDAIIFEASSYTSNIATIMAWLDKANQYYLMGKRLGNGERPNPTSTDATMLSIEAFIYFRFLVCIWTPVIPKTTFRAAQAFLTMSYLGKC